MNPLGVPYALRWLLRFGLNKLRGSNGVGYQPGPAGDGPAVSPRSPLQDPFQPDKVPARLDAIVIGAGLGGLVLGASLAKKGQRVLVLEQHLTVGGCLAPYAFDGHEVDVGFHYVGMMLPEASQRTHDFFYPLIDWLCAGKQRWRKLAATDVVHLLDQGRQVSIHLGEEWRHFRSLLKEMFPAEQAGIDRVYDLYRQGDDAFRAVIGQKSLPPALRPVLGRLIFPCAAEAMTLWEKTGRQVLEEHLIDPTLRMLMAQYYGGFSLPLGQLPFPALAAMQQALAYGVYYPVGGTASVLGHLCDTIREAGGRVLTRARVEKVVVRDGRAVGVQLDPPAGGCLITAPRVVSDIGLRETYTRLVPQVAQRQPAIRALLDQVPVGASRVMLNVILDASGDELGFHQGQEWVIPNIERDAQWVRFEAAETEMPSYIFAVFPGQRNLEKYAGRRTSLMTLICFVPYRRVQQWARSYSRPRQGSPAYRAFKDEVGRKILDVFLGTEKWRHLRGHIKKVDVATPLTMEYYLAHDEGSICGLAHTRERFLDPLTSPYTPLPGLYLTGADVGCSGVLGAGLGGYLTAVALLAEDPSKELKAKMAAAGQVTTVRNDRGEFYFSN